MLGGIGDQAIYDALVPLGICPLVMTGTDTALLHQAARVGAERAIASDRTPRLHRN